MSIIGSRKCHNPGADPEPRHGFGPPPHTPKNNKNIRFLSNTGPDPLTDHKATKPAFIVGPSLARQRNTIQMMSDYNGPSHKLKE